MVVFYDAFNSSKAPKGPQLKSSLLPPSVFNKAECTLQDKNKNRG